MDGNLTSNINNSNIYHIREQINRKKESTPFLPTVGDASKTITDYDTFPYPRWYRGIPDAVEPIVAEREAGWRVRHDDCYKVKVPPKVYKPPNHCFESACNTVYPCTPSFFNKFADKEAVEISIHNACISQYR